MKPPGEVEKPWGRLAMSPVIIKKFLAAGNRRERHEVDAFVGTTRCRPVHRIRF